MIYGPYVRQPGERPPARIEDLAPTILALLGLPVPAEMDGRVLSEWLGEVPVETGLPQAPTLPTPALPPYSEEEAAAIARRLRALGYLD